MMIDDSLRWDSTFTEQEDAGRKAPLKSTYESASTYYKVLLFYIHSRYRSARDHDIHQNIDCALNARFQSSAVQYKTKENALEVILIWQRLV